MTWASEVIFKSPRVRDVAQRTVLAQYIRGPGFHPAPQKGGKSTLKSSLEAGCARMAGAPFNPSTTEAEVCVSL